MTMGADTNSKNSHLQFSRLDFAALSDSKLFLRHAIERRRILGYIFSACLIASIGYAIFAPKWYRAEVVAMLSDTKQASAGLSSLESVANLAGIPFSSPSSLEPLAILRSRELGREFIVQQGLTREFSSNQQSSGPSTDDLREAVKFLDERIRKISEDKKSGTITVAMSWTSPEVAAKWANAYVNLLNERMKNDAIAESEVSIQFLQEELSRTQLLSVQQAIGRVLEGQLQKLALARGRKEFAYKIVDPAVPPRRAYWPRTWVVILAGIAAAGIIILILVSWTVLTSSDSPD